MAAKFMNIKRIVLPFITVVIIASQLSGCAIFSRGEMAEIMHDSPELVIEYVEPKQETEINQNQVDDFEELEDPEDEEIGVLENIGTLDDEEAEDPEEVEQEHTTEVSEQPQVEQQEAQQEVKVETPAPSSYSFTDIRETVFATTTVNVRENFNTNSDKVGALTKGQSIVRIGLGQGEAAGWSKVEFNGSVAYISSDYLSTTKPVTPPPNTKPSGGSQSSSGSQTTKQPSKPSTSTPAPTPSSGGQQTTGGSGSPSEDELADIFRKQMEQSGSIGAKNEITQEDRDWISGSINLD